MRPRPLIPLLVAATVALAGCSAGSAAGVADGAPEPPVTTLHVGYFPNLTHAAALVGQHEGLFDAALEPLGVTVEPMVFNAGPDAVSALFGGSLDIAYMGPNPTINAYVQSGGQAVRVIAGAASGGAALVVRAGIDGASDLPGTTLATPQVGNTQDVALRTWLDGQGLSADTQGSGDVAIMPQANAEGLAAFAAGRIDGAWVPEPWVTEYLRAGAHVLVDEADLWPDGRFVTTNVVVRTPFLAEHPDVVEAFLSGHVAALDLIAGDPDAAAAAVSATLASLTGSSPSADVLDRALGTVEFTADPLPATLVGSARNAVSVGLLDEAGIATAGGLPGTLYDLSALNAVLERAGRAAVEAS